MEDKRAPAGFRHDEAASFDLFVQKKLRPTPDISVSSAIEYASFRPCSGISIDSIMSARTSMDWRCLDRLVNYKSIILEGVLFFTNSSGRALSASSSSKLSSELRVCLPLDPRPFICLTPFSGPRPILAHARIMWSAAPRIVNQNCAFYGAGHCHRGKHTRSSELNLLELDALNALPEELVKNKTPSRMIDL